MSTQQQPQDFGIKIADPNYDATKASDYQLLFNSSWPSVAIAYQETKHLIGPVSPGGTITFNHNLGFPPFCMINVSTDGAPTVGPGWTNIWVGPSSTNCDWLLPNVNNMTATFSGNGIPGQWDQNQSIYITLTAYNIDLSKQKDYTFVEGAGAPAGYDSNYGLKLAKEGKDVNSKDLRDFIIHTRGQSPAVLSVVTQQSATAGTGTLMNVAYTNPAGYTAWIFAYARKTVAGASHYEQAGLGSQSPPALFIDSPGNIFRVQYDTANSYDGAALVVLRDPLFAPNNIQVNY